MKKNKHYTISFNYFVPAILLCFLMLTYSETLDGTMSYYGANDKYSSINVRSAIDSSDDYPYWYPWMMAGIPSVHSAQNISDYYPPNHVIKFLNSIGMPWFWNYIIHLLFAGLGMYLLCLHIKINKFISIIPSLGFINLPYMTGMLVHGHGSQVMTICYLPWVFLFYLKIKSDPSFKNLSIFSILLCLQLLRGHVQMAYYTWMVIGIVIMIEIIINLLSHKKNNLKWLLYTFFGLFLSVIGSLKLYLPIISYLPMSTRSIGKQGGSGIEYATDYSFSFSELMTFIIPSFSGFGDQTYWGTMPFTSFPQYMSLVVLIFALYGVLRGDGGRIKLYSIICLIFFLLLSMGKNLMGFYSFFYNYLPLFSKFRNPAYLLVIVQFFVMILGGLGLSKIFFDLKQSNRTAHGFLLIVFSLTFFSSLIDFSKYGEKAYLYEKNNIIEEYKNNLIRSNPDSFSSSLLSNYDDFINEQLKPIDLVYQNKIILSEQMIKTDIILIHILVVSTILLTLISCYNKNGNKKNKSFNSYIFPVLCFLIGLVVFFDLYVVNRKITNPENSHYLIRKSAITSYENFYESVGISLDQKSLIKNKENYLNKPLTNIQNDIINLNNKDFFRILDLDGTSNSNGWSKFKVEDVSGYHPAKLKSYQKMMQLNSGYILRLLNVKYIIQNNEINPFDGENRVFFAKTLYQDQSDNFERRVNLYKTNSLPSNASYLTSYKKNLEESIKLDWIFDESLNVNYKNFYQSAEDRINHIDNSNPNEISIDLTTSGEQFIIISEIYYQPGWVAELDGNPTNIHEVNDLVRGIYVKNKGKHNIKMSFVPSDIVWGNIFFLSYLILVTVLLFFDKFKYKISKKWPSFLKK